MQRGKHSLHRAPARGRCEGAPRGTTASPRATAAHRSGRVGAGLGQARTGRASGSDPVDPATVVQPAVHALEVHAERHCGEVLCSEAREACFFTTGFMCQQAMCSAGSRCGSPWCEQLLDARRPAASAWPKILGHDGIPVATTLAVVGAGRPRFPCLQSGQPFVHHKDGAAALLVLDLTKGGARRPVFGRLPPRYPCTRRGQAGLFEATARPKLGA